MNEMIRLQEVGNSFSPWSIFQGGLVGPYHKMKGEGSQDYARGVIIGDSVVIAAADGAGSHEHSLSGSTHMVESVLRLLEGFLESEGCLSVFDVIQSVVAAREQLLRYPYARRMGCTFAVVAVGPWGWVSWVLGDAFAVITTDDGHTLIQPKSTGEFSNVTELINGSRLNPHIQSGNDKVVSVAVSTDGLIQTTIDMTKDKHEPFPGVWNVLSEKAIGGNLDAQGFLSHLEGKGLIEDDTTLLMAALRSK